MRRIAPSWIIWIALECILHLSIAQNSAYVPSTKVIATLGKSTNFTCQSHGIPITTCLLERDSPKGSTGGGSGTLILNFHPSNAKPGEGQQPGYTYLGEGLEKGECGVVIQNVREDDYGDWRCTLMTNIKLYRGLVTLLMSRKPGPPKFNPNQLRFNFVDNQLRGSRVVCFSKDGQPPPRFQWFIDNEPLTEGLSLVNTTVSNGDEYTYQELNRRFSYRDNEKKLRCVVVHDSLSADDKKEVTMNIEVLFPPRSTWDNGSSEVSVQAEIGAEKVLSVKVAANPKPDQVMWTINSNTILEGQSTADRYDAEMLQYLGRGIYQANLRIRSVAEEDKHFTLRVRNNIDTTEFDFIVTPVTPESTSGGGIVLLIIGIAAFIIIIPLGVVYAITQRLLCFKK